MSIDSIDLDILKFLSTRENYEQYKGVVNKSMCTKESWTLVHDFGEYFKQYPNEQMITVDFLMWMRVSGHPTWKPEEHSVYANIISNMYQQTLPTRPVLLSELDKLNSIQKIKQGTTKLEAGTISLDEFLSGVNTSTVPKELDTVQVYSLEALAKNQRDNKGLFWRLEDLNRSVGPIRKGDLVIIGKRPEVGGTSFLVSEQSYMLEQLGKDQNVVLFNNEEAPDKVYSRMVSSALDVDYRTLIGNPSGSQFKYDAWANGRDWDLIHDTQMTIQGIHSHLKGKQYDLIGINVLLKVGGTGEDADHDKLQKLGEELRRIAQQYGPVLAIVQADPSAEGMRFIPQDRIYKSKTALQGEADVLLMMGKDDDPNDNKRFFHVAKNKLPPAPCTDLAAKHLKFECNFDISTGRFDSINFKGNSRSMK